MRQPFVQTATIKRLDSRALGSVDDRVRQYEIESTDHLSMILFPWLETLL